MLPDAEQLAEMCMAAVKTATAPLLARIHVLEQRPVVVPKDGRDGEKGEPGKDADPAVVHELKAQIETLQSELVSVKAVSQDLVREAVRAEVSALPPAPAGKDADPDLVATLVDDAVMKAFTGLPAPRDGTSVSAEDVRPMISDEVQKAVSALPPAQAGEPGRDVDPDVVDALVAMHVTKAFSSLTPPKDGTSVTVDDVKPLIVAEVTKAVDALPKPKDGVSVSSSFVDREGRLIHTFSDGATKEVGSVVGRDGKDADPAVLERMVEEAVAKIPRPKDGRDGTLEHLKVVQMDERTYALCFKDGTPIEGGSLTFAHPLDRGVWREQSTYVKGDGATFGGSFFIAQRDDPGKPEVGDGWRLAVKRGRDGQAGKDFTPKAK